MGVRLSAAYARGSGRWAKRVCPSCVRYACVCKPLLSCDGSLLPESRSLLRPHPVALASRRVSSGTRVCRSPRSRPRPVPQRGSYTPTSRLFYVSSRRFLLRACRSLLRYSRSLLTLGRVAELHYARAQHLPRPPRRGYGGHTSFYYL